MDTDDANVEDMRAAYDAPVNPFGTLLTERELEIALKLAVGDKNSEIADALGISIKTVDTHRAHVLKKLGCRNNVDLARRALRAGLVTL